MAYGPLSLFVIPSQLWRLVVFQFCFVNFVVAKWVDHPHDHVYIVPIGEARLLVTVRLKFRSQLSDDSARGLAVLFYSSEARGLLSPTFTLTC